MALRRDVLGYVSQFLRVVPRVPALEVVAEPLLGRGVAADLARDRAAVLLTRLNVPQALWELSPLTFSGGEQQRMRTSDGARCSSRSILTRHRHRRDPRSTARRRRVKRSHDDHIGRDETAFVTCAFAIRRARERRVRPENQRSLMGRDGRNLELDLKRICQSAAFS
jgi:hypothetical protein